MNLSWFIGYVTSICRRRCVLTVAISYRRIFVSFLGLLRRSLNLVQVAASMFARFFLVM